MAMTADATVTSLMSSFKAGKRTEAPYRHWLVDKCLPDGAIDTINGLPFPAPTLGGVSGKREVHNATRKYFDVENRATYPVISAISDAFQDPRVTRGIESVFDTKLDDTYLRIEFAQDTNGFWLEPHSDLGVKVFTLLLYVSTDPTHGDLGTDIYDAGKQHVGRSPFIPNSAMIFVPSKITMHGFEPRQIHGVRKSVIVNYVTNDWIAREQLAFPGKPIKH
jgi:hypothetical protein